jgi:acetolactate synthase-1/2/3 large subunit
MQPDFVDSDANATASGSEGTPPRRSTRSAANAVDLPSSSHSEVLTGAQAISEVLARRGVVTAFSYAGTSELALCDALGSKAGINLMNARGDAQSVFMAAGGSVLTPLRAIAVLHGARGLTNALGAIASMRRDEIGAIILIGLPSTTSSSFLPPHGERGLMHDAASFAKSTYELGVVQPNPVHTTGEDAVLQVLTQAITDAITPPWGPVLCGVPQDLSERRFISAERARSLQILGPSRRVIRDEDIQPAVSHVESSRRPVILIDDYFLRYAGSRAALSAFATRIAAPVLQLRYRRGPMLFERIRSEDVPAFVGWLDPFNSEHQTLMRSADLLITLEDRNMYERVLGPMPTCRKIAITSDRHKAEKNGYLTPADSLIEGDVVAVLEAISARLPAEGRTTWYSARAKGNPEKSDHDVASEDAGGILRRELPEIIAEAMSLVEQPVLIDDSQMFGGLLGQHYDRLPRSLRIVGSHAGFVGSGLSTAAGLALSDSGRFVFCTLGDQGFGNAFQGLVAAGEHQARVVFIVINNGGSVSLQTEARARGHLQQANEERHLRNAGNVDPAALAAACGIQSSSVDLRQVSDASSIRGLLEEFRRDLRAATARDGPTLIELVLPPAGSLWTDIWSVRGLDGV